MIGELCSQLRQQLAEAGRLEQQQDEMQDIKATLDTLNMVRETIRKLKVPYQVVWSRLPVDDIQSIRQQTASIAESIEASRSDFEHNRRQIQPLKKIEKDVQSIQKSLDARWKMYAQAQLSPHEEMLKLVRALPEIAGQEQAINELLSHLRAYTKELPSSHAKLTEFDTRLQQLSSRLATLQGLSPGVRDFLRKVQDGTATLHDLSDDILHWCRQGDHARVFTITFRGEKGR